MTLRGVRGFRPEHENSEDLHRSFSRRGVPRAVGLSVTILFIEARVLLGVSLEALTWIRNRRRVKEAEESMAYDSLGTLSLQPHRLITFWQREPTVNSKYRRPLGRARAEVIKFFSERKQCMAEMHSYAATSRHQSRILGAIAFVSAFAAIGTYYGFRWMIIEIKPAVDVNAYGWLIGPLTLTGYYSLFLAIFDRYLWQFFSAIPFVGGTWAGCTQPNYQEWTHLSVLKVDQTWSTIYVELSHFWRSREDTKWSTAKRLGRDQSGTAALSAKRANEANFGFSYQHKGIKSGQADFDGTMALIVDLKAQRLQGKYYTNRPSLVDGTVCSYGHVILYRLSRDLLSAEEALKSLIENEALLSTAIREVADMAGRENGK